jgi:NTP pyrophosphatase (non-canonical NTP hydrolase)
MDTQPPFQAALWITNARNLEDYVAFTRTTAKYPQPSKTERQDAFTYLALGLSNEYGEYIQKRFGDDEHAPSARAELISEIGDCFWYLFRIYDTLGIELPSKVDDDDHNLSDLIPFIVHSGIIQGVAKKVIRDNISIEDPIVRAKLQKSLNKCYSALRRHCLRHQFSFWSVLEYNMKKLQGRLERNTLCGDGDNR